MAVRILVDAEQVRKQVIGLPEAISQRLAGLPALLRRAVRIRIAERAFRTGRLYRSVTSSEENGFFHVFSEVNYSEYVEAGTSRMRPRYPFKDAVRAIPQIIGKLLRPLFARMK